ncbi:CI-B8 domain-containing protein [Xylariaceae sp. FL0016]|nr:CI-B8 domain-containing protein [Xylariaceae sp. FL0016]
MVNPGKRMNILQALLALRHGPGAAILPPEITRIHLDFAKFWNDGHLGPRKFWKQCLPRLKFWNPAIPMLVNRFDEQSNAATLSIYFKQTAAEAAAASPTANSPSALLKSTRKPLPLAQQPHSSTRGEHPAPPPEDDERVVTINMKGVHSEQILAEFIAKTGAILVRPSPDEQVEMRQVEERSEKAAFDRAIVKKFIDDKRHKQRMLDLARQEADAIKKANQ